MVQLKSLFDKDGIRFIAARNFILKGSRYVPGDVVSGEVLKSIRTGEALLRSSRIVAVTDDRSVLPRSLAGHVKEEAIFRRKFKLPPAEGNDGDDGDDGGSTDPDLFSPTGKTIAEVQAYLQHSPVEEVARVANLEVRGDARTTLLSWLDTKRNSVANNSYDELYFSDFLTVPSQYSDWYIAPFNMASLNEGQTYTMTSPQGDPLELGVSAAFLAHVFLSPDTGHYEIADDQPYGLFNQTPLGEFATRAEIQDVLTQLDPELTVAQFGAVLLIVPHDSAPAPELETLSVVPFVAPPEQFSPVGRSVAEVQSYLDDKPLPEVIRVARIEACADTPRSTLLTWCDAKYNALSPGLGDVITLDDMDIPNRAEEHIAAGHYATPFNVSTLEEGKTYKLEVTGGDFTVDPEYDWVFPAGRITIIQHHREQYIFSYIKWEGKGVPLDGVTPTTDIITRAEGRDLMDSWGGTYVESEVFATGPVLYFFSDPQQGPDLSNVTFRVVEVEQEG